MESLFDFRATPLTVVEVEPELDWEICLGTREVVADGDARTE